MVFAEAVGGIVNHINGQFFSDEKVRGDRLVRHDLAVVVVRDERPAGSARFRAFRALTRTSVLGLRDADWAGHAVGNEPNDMYPVGWVLAGCVLGSVQVGERGSVGARWART
jgi:hypothetical protein